ncbi:2-deoxy-scyllo-inosose synthase [Nocardia anaemiae]|uniref:2-deoxy-scyllo-inosose synthase n=1 Tax=Nocardia anaemiae TaxID=263910 RepID=UPI000A04F3C7|nr:2-deoxy-scyllo-inosose synthase [Nocardia anaemiae]
MPSTEKELVSHPNMQQRHIRIGESEFPYLFGIDCLDTIAETLDLLDADRFVVVTDDHVFGLHGQELLRALGSKIPVTVLSHEPGEAMKTLSCLSEHIEHALQAGATRRSVVVAFGGGVPGNLAGLIASLLFRGVRLVHIPTTTVSAMDSVLSLKQAINSRVGKNHIGSYYAPAAVLTDVALFSTLSPRELRSGLGEMTKNCLAIMPETIPELQRILAAGELAAPESLLWLLDASISAKGKVTQDDTYERKRGLVLEYGHTIGHAIELLDYRQRDTQGLSHGESIALGMLIAARISFARGWLTEEEVEIHDELVTALGITARFPDGMTIDQIIDTIHDDNKRGYLPLADDAAAFVLLQKLGTPAQSGELPLVSVTAGEVRAALEAFVAGVRDTASLVAAEAV